MLNPWEITVYLCRIAPNVGNLSHVWRVWSCVSLQTWVIYLAFGGFETVWRSKRERIISHLEGYCFCIAPNAGNPSHVWRV